jgi:hypothetical protein
MIASVFHLYYVVVTRLGIIALVGTAFGTTLVALRWCLRRMSGRDRVV